MVSVAVEDGHYQVARDASVDGHRSLGHVFYPRIGVVAEPRLKFSFYILGAYVDSGTPPDFYYLGLHAMPPHVVSVG